MAVDEEKAAITWELTGTHNDEFMGKKPTGKKIKVCVMNFYYINKEGKIYKDVAAEGMIGILRPLGIVSLDQAHAQMSRMNEADANRISVRIELQADFYAGVWGYYENKTFKSLDDGDLREAIDCAAVIGDDYLQKKATGGFNPESFTHGTSDQRMKWLKLGLTTGDMNKGNTFNLSDSQL